MQELLDAACTYGCFGKRDLCAVRIEHYVVASLSRGAENDAEGSYHT